MPKLRGLSNRKRQGRGRKNNPEIIVCGLAPDTGREWLRKFYARRTQPLRPHPDTFAEYVRQNHPHKLPKGVVNVAEYMRCVLRGLYRDDDL